MLHGRAAEQAGTVPRTAVQGETGMLQIAIVEDEKECLSQLSGYAARYGEEHGLELRISEFLDAGALLQGYDGRFDILLLDIELPQVNGMRAAEEIRAKDPDVVIMFITNMAQYAIQGYAVGALDYVLKPVSWYTFQVRFGRAVERAASRRDDELLLSTRDGVVRLHARAIHYIEIQNRMLHYHTGSGDYEVRGTLQSAEKQVAPWHFARCNHWYLVNLEHVRQVKGNLVVVGGDDPESAAELEISRRSKSAFLDALTRYMGGNI